MMRILIGVGCGMAVMLSVGLSAAEQNTLFNKLDKDNNGVVSREEFTACPLVRTKDGRVQHQELCANPGISLSLEEKNRLYDRIDTDKRGAITRKKLNRFATPDGFAPLRF